MMYRSHPMATGLLVMLATSFLIPVAADQECDWTGPRVDCGYVGITEGECRNKGCCWNPADFQDFPYVDVPWCFTQNAHPAEYEAAKIQEDNGGGSYAELALVKSVQPELGPDVTKLSASVRRVGCDTLRLTLRDADEARWEVPTHLFKSDILAGQPCSPQAPVARQRPGSGPSMNGACGGSATTLEYNLLPHPFSLTVTRSGDGAPLFNSTGQRLVFKDQYLELSTGLSPGATLFGAGERVSRSLHLARNGAPRPLWNRDIGPALEEQNSYGSHPWVLGLEPDGTAWGILLLSSNAMDIIPSEEKLSWRVTGGIIDMFVFGGPTPLAVMEQFTAVIGRPALVPYWTLGWHQCKYGYASVWEVREVVANYSAAGLPLEAQWIDIDQMDHWMDFTFDPVDFPVEEMQALVEDLHANGQKFVPILDPGIKVEPGYHAYDEALKRDLFVRNVEGDPYLGWVWPGPCHFLDYLLPRTAAYWEEELAAHHNILPWDGIWIDMNEISNFCTGDLCRLKPETESEVPTLPSSRQEGLGKDPQWVCHLECWEAQGLNSTQAGWAHPPYDIANGLARSPLGYKVMSVLNSHHDGSSEYDAHQLYSLAQTRVTAAAVESIRRKRPFILSRSSYLGVGAYAAHWTGDNVATWDQLAKSIAGVLNIGLFGIAMGGADICGFQGNTTSELCARWVSLGAFYPFARSHSDLHSTRQELYLWPEVAEAGRQALSQRYRLLPYLYSTMRAAHDTGAPAMRPLWMTFPEDVAGHRNDRQFMFGDALLVTPVLTQGARSVEGHFPPGTWYSLWNASDVVHARANGTDVTLDAPLERIPYHVRGGRIIGTAEPRRTTRDTKAGALTLLVALPGEGSGAERSAHGVVYNDDGESVVQARASPCSFLHANVTVRRDGQGSLSGTLKIAFGSSWAWPGGARYPDDALGGAESVAADGDPPIPWPSLAGLRILGWEGGAPEAVRTRSFRPSGEASGSQGQSVVDLNLAEGARVKDSTLLLSMESVELPLDCPGSLEIEWGPRKTAQYSDV
ncbi:AGL1 [Auxenochlorella protothecoides x Auxenochlorella symbiontica]